MKTHIMQNFYLILKIANSEKYLENMNYCRKNDIIIIRVSIVVQCNKSNVYDLSFSEVL